VLKICVRNTGFQEEGCHEASWNWWAFMV
jgi:hypothetical protein